MGLAVASVILLKVAAVWIVLQWGFDALIPRVPSLRPVVGYMKEVNGFLMNAVVTLCALLVVLPSSVFVVLRVFEYVGQRTRSLQAKTLPEYLAHGVGILQGLEAMSERIREVALSLTADVEETMYEKSDVSAPEPGIVPQTCGNVLLAVCKHSESLERLYMALQPTEVDELIFCDCEDFEFRGEKIVSLIGILRECMERQTEVVKAVDALCPMLPPAAGTICDEDVDDSGFIDC